MSGAYWWVVSQPWNTGRWSSMLRSKVVTFACMWREQSISEEIIVALLFFFFFQAEDGIRDLIVTGVQTCTLPIFDAEGNVYGSDRGIPRRLVKLNPRTGERKEWVTPHPKSDVHEVLISPDGMIWMPEHAEGGVRSYLLGFNPKTEKWDVNVDGDPTDVVRNGIKWMQSQ